MKRKGIGVKEGFTLIETVLVLGIAGLIFLMMIIALPALQRTERDTERKEDVAHLLEKIKEYQTNNRGALPGLSDTGDEIEVEVSDTSGAASTSWAGFYRDFLGAGFVDPAGTNYKLKIVKCTDINYGGVVGSECSNNGTKNAVAALNGGGFEDNEMTIYVVIQAACAGNESTGVVASSNQRKVAALYRLEGGGVYCSDT